MWPKTCSSQIFHRPQVILHGGPNDFGHALASQTRTDRDQPERTLPWTFPFRASPAFRCASSSKVGSNIMPSELPTFVILLKSLKNYVYRIRFASRFR